MRRVIVIVVLVAVFFVAAVPILGSAQSNNNTATTAQTSIKRAMVDKGEVTLTASATGKIVVKDGSNLSFQESGRVKEILVSEGQSVKAGQILAKLDDATLQANLLKAEDGVTAAQAVLEKVVRPVDAGDIAKQEASVKSAEASYSSAASSVNADTVKSYQLQYDKAVAAADAAEKNRIHAGGQYANTDPQYQTALAQVGQAQMNAQIAGLQLQQAQVGSSLLSATAKITCEQAVLAQIKAGPTQNEIAAAQISLVTAQLERDQAKHDLELVNLVAPYDGVISSISAKVGALASGTAMVITDTSELGADIKVDEAEIGNIQVGQSVKLTFDALSGVSLTGKVQHVAETADTTSSVITYVVHVMLDASKAGLKPGMTTTAVITTQDRKDAIRIPNQYLKTNRTTGQSTVTVANANGTLTAVPVTVGAQGTDYTEILDGLNAGETVVLITSTAATTSNNG